MKNAVKTIKISSLIIISILFLFSCNKTPSDETKVTNENTAENKVSKVASDPEFINKIHSIRNPMTNTTMLVKGDGTIVLKMMEPSIEQVEVIEDIDANTTNYIYKVYSGEGLEKHTYGEGDSACESIDMTVRSVFFDKDGKEVGLTTNTYGAKYSTKDKIIYRDNSETYGENDLKVFNVNTKETTTLPYSNLETFDGNFVMSTDEYGNDEKEVTIICDENFNELKRIEGYSLNGVETRNGVHLVNLSRRVENDRKYNYLDESYSFIFDEDIDERIYSDTFPVLTVRRGKTAFDYDFSKREKVSEDRPYVEEKTNWEKMQEEESKYSDLFSKINKEGEYQYFSPFTHNDTVLFIAHKRIDIGMFDDDTCDVYNDKLEMVATFKSLDNSFIQEGYIFANKNTVYNEKMETVKKFDTNCMIEKIEKFDKVFFSNGTAADYSSRTDFELYDVNFNVVLDHIDSIETYAYDDYIVITKEGNTYFLDKDLNVANEITGRALIIRDWYNIETNYKSFTDASTGRMGVINNDLHIVVDNLKYIDNMTEKYFTYQNGFKYGFMDYDGIPIYTYSVFDTMREDAVEKDFDGEFVTEY